MPGRPRTPLNSLTRRAWRGDPLLCSLSMCTLIIFRSRFVTSSARSTSTAGTSASTQLPPAGTPTASSSSMMPTASPWRSAETSRLSELLASRISVSRPRPRRRPPFPIPPTRRRRGFRRGRRRGGLRRFKCLDPDGHVVEAAWEVRLNGHRRLTHERSHGIGSCAPQRRPRAVSRGPRGSTVLPDSDRRPVARFASVSPSV